MAVCHQINSCPLPGTLGGGSSKHREHPGVGGRAPSISDKEGNGGGVAASSVHALIPVGSCSGNSQECVAVPQVKPRHGGDGQGGVMLVSPFLCPT